MLDDAYIDREQSQVKHEALQRYLSSFAHIVGSHWNSITYIDGFSGPWNAQKTDLSDTSFAIALNELRKARDTHRRSGREIRLRCVFVEKDATAFQRLDEFCQTVADVETRRIPGHFEEAIPEIIEFVRADRDTFPFTFIDPTGYSGFGMKRIAPLLRIEPGEVLINFMLEFIRRSIEHDGLRACYEQLFGTADYDDSLENLEGIDRDDAITEKYCECIGRECGFEHVLRATVLHPDKDRLNFQLIYGTRHPKGVAVFKKAEEQLMQTQEQLRASVEARQTSRGGQLSFLDPGEMPVSQYYKSLRDRYREQARSKVALHVNTSIDISYDDLWLCALRFPMVWESDLRGWLGEWRDHGLLEWRGLAPRGRKLLHGKNHRVVLVSASVV